MQDEINLAKICDQAYLTYRQSSQQRKGVIGETEMLYTLCHGMSLKVLSAIFSLLDSMKNKFCNVQS